MAYDDPLTPANPARPAQGQRCASCGHLEPDAWARFCGVCGGTLGHGGPPAAGPPVAHEPAVRYGTVGPPMQQSYAAPPAYPAGLGGPVDRPQPVLYTVPSVGVVGPARIGAGVSAAFMLLPCVLLAFGGAWAIHAGRKMLESWQGATVKIPIPLVSVDLGMNFVDLLHVRPILNDLVYWDERLWLAFAILWLGPWVLWIIAGALFGVVFAAIYNLIGKLGGGVRVTLRPAMAPGGGSAYPPAGWQGGAPPAPSGGWQGPPGQLR